MTFTTAITALGQRKVQVLIMGYLEPEATGSGRGLEATGTDSSEKVCPQHGGLCGA